MRPRLSPALLVLCLACEGGTSTASTSAAPKPDTPPPAASSDAAPEPTDAPIEGDAKTRAAAVKARAKAESAKLAPSRASLLKLLNDGRAAVKAKRYDEGIGLYREALKIDPADPRVLGELGFAALRSGDLDLAESSTRLAIAMAPHGHASLGSLYYNLGLVEEARDNPGAAKTAYERSLAERPANAIVEAKLAKLTAAPVAKGPASVLDLCPVVMSDWACAENPPEDSEDLGQCTCTLDEQIEEPSGESFIVAAAILKLEGMGGMGGSIDEGYLAIQTRGEGWQLIGQLLNGYSPGMMGISNNYELMAFEFVDLGPAPGHELKIDAANSELDSNMGINSLDFSDSRELTLCASASASAGSCATLMTHSSMGTEILFEDEPVDPDVEIGAVSSELKVTLADGAVEVAVVSGEEHLTDAQKRVVGSRPFAEFVTLLGGFALR